MKSISCLLLASLLLFQFTGHAQKKTKPVVIAYVGGYRGIAHTDSIEANKLSHINYAFVDVRNNRAWLHNEITDTTNLKNLFALKNINPDLKVLISIGGWTWSKNFSDAVLSDTSRKNFAVSAVAIVADYKLDGIDIDWEYPGMFGDSNMYRAVDKENYTLMFKSLREQLDSLSAITHQKYQVTTAVGGFTSFITHTEMAKVSRYLDYVNIMSYDFKENTDSISGHHTNLYASKGDLTAPSAHKSVKEFIAAGVPAKKIVMGVAFYGKGWLMQDDTNRGLLQKALQPARGGGFTYLKDSVIDKNGFVRYWDSTAKAPYLYQQTGRIFISYDDEESIAYKCRYIKKYKLGGIMFWEYASDKKGYLLHTIADEFKYTNK